MLIGVNFCTKTRYWHLQIPLFANIYYTVFTARTSKLTIIFIKNFFKQSWVIDKKKQSIYFATQLITLSVTSGKKIGCLIRVSGGKKCFSDKNRVKLRTPCYLCVNRELCWLNRVILRPPVPPFYITETLECQKSWWGQAFVMVITPLHSASKWWLRWRFSQNGN